jgi:hypothetical protein
MRSKNHSIMNRTTLKNNIVNKNQIKTNSSFHKLSSRKMLKNISKDKFYKKSRKALEKLTKKSSVPVLKSSEKTIKLRNKPSSIKK